VPGQVSVLLLDADGVVQRPAPGWRDAVASLCGADADPESFLDAVFRAERPCLRGDAEFAPLLAAVLERFGSTANVDEALAVWTQIVLEPGIRPLIERLPLPVYLATNQQRYRARHMQTTLGYAQLFDDVFLSFELRACKPEPEFFARVLDRLAAPAREVLLIDDQEKNVHAARQAGMQAERFHLDEGLDRLRGLLRAYGLQTD
jgi:putative hydrolase of the HAD superfamily